MLSLTAGRKSNHRQPKHLHTRRASVYSAEPGQAQDTSSVKRYKNYMLKASTDRQLSSFWTEYLEHLHISGPVTSLTSSLRQQDEDLSLLLLLKSFNILIQSLLKQEPSSSFNEKQLGLWLLSDGAPSLRGLLVTSIMPTSSSLPRAQLSECFISSTCI